MFLFSVFFFRFVFIQYFLFYNRVDFIFIFSIHLYSCSTLGRFLAYLFMTP